MATEAADLEAVVAFERTLPPSDKRTQDQWLQLRGRLKSALAAVGLTEATDDKMLLARKKLTARQANAIELLAGHPHIPTGKFGIPVPSWAKREWLGLDAVGPLFKGAQPLLARVFAADDDEDSVTELVNELPVAARIQAMVDLLLIDGFDYDYLEPLLIETLADMPRTMGAWGRRVADRVLASIDKPWAPLEGTFGVAHEVLLTVLYAIVRAGAPIEPTLDRLVTVADYPYDPRKYIRECVLAIPEDRRERALLDALGRRDSFVGHIGIALAVLEDFPYPSIARDVLAHLADANHPKNVLQALGEVAIKHPAIADVVANFKSKQKPAPKLAVIERGKPTIKQLDANAKKQVALSAKRFDGRKQTAADLVAGRGDEPLAPFERIAIADAKGKLAYEAWLHPIDAGSIYKAGTTRLVAEIIQDGLECDDAALREALVEVIHAKPKRKTPAKTKR